MTEPEKKQALKAFFVLGAGMTVITFVYLILIYPYRFSISSASPLFMLKYLFVSIDLILIILYFFFHFIKTNKFEELLDDDFRNSFEQIMFEINRSYLTKQQKNEIKNDLLELLITSQESNRCVHQVVCDTGSFANDIIKSYGKYQWVLIGLANGFLYTTIFILVEPYLPYLLSFDRYIFQQSIFSNSSNLDSLFMVASIFFIQIPMQRISNLEKNKFLLFASLFFFLYFWLTRFNNSFFSREINLIPNIYVLLIYILIIPLSILLKKTIRNKTKIQLINGD